MKQIIMKVTIVSFFQDKTDTEKGDVEVEERKFEPSGNDRDLVDVLGKLFKIYIVSKENRQLVSKE